MLQHLPSFKPDSLLAAVLKPAAAGGNQFLSGGLVLMIVGGLAAWGRRLPSEIWQWLIRRCTVTADIMNSDPAFHWVTAYLDKQPYAKRSRRLSVTTERDRDGVPSGLLFTPAPGDHFFWLNRRPVWFSRERKDSVGKGEMTAQQFLSPLAPETYQLRVFGRSQQCVRDILLAARAAQQVKDKEYAQVFTSVGSWWKGMGRVPDRPLSSVLLPVGEAERVLANVRWFKENREWYNQRGVPYRRGYLLHGEPGCGKSSLISSIAHEYGLNIYSLSLTSVSSDAGLNELLGEIGGNALLCIEDIDAAVEGRQLTKGGEDTKRGSGITLSGLLNALDGIVAREGLLVFMTSNYKDRLDPALVRPGRADVHVRFTFAEEEQLERMFLRFFPEDAELAHRFAAIVGSDKVTMAEVQQHMLVHHDDPHQAVLTAESIGRERLNGEDDVPKKATTARDGEPELRSRKWRHLKARSGRLKIIR